MSDFSTDQLHVLKSKLPRRHVQTRDVDGRSLDYIEGWFAIAQANAIFGFAGWDRETTHFERLYERTRPDATSCSYLARVRIRVRAGDTIIVREGTGSGSATAASSGDAHERALKAAETDATKRALATFGNRFGLGLYDKEQNGVTGKKVQTPADSFTIYDPTGALFAGNLTPESFCSGLRQLIEVVIPAELETLARYNKEGIARLRVDAPALKTAKRVHYADILERLIKDRLTVPPPSAASPEIEAPLPAPPPLAPSRIAPGPRIDKSVLAIGTERRLRDKAHLQFVGSQPCLICGRKPSHAHHVSFMQRRALAMKVSDEFTVPLCAVHHDELHRSGGERSWWATRQIKPAPIAAELWAASRAISVGGGSQCVSQEDALPNPQTMNVAIVPIPETRILT